MSTLTDEELNSYTKKELIEYIREIENLRSGFEVTEELEQQRKRVAESEKFASLGILAAGIGHEINNPLGVIKGMSFFINRKIQEYKDTEILHRIEVIDECVSRISEIVDGLRTMARSDTNHSNPFDSHYYLKKSVGMVYEVYKKEGVSISLSLEAKDSHFVGSIGKFQQVCMNLLTNAKDAINEAGREEDEIIIRSWNDQGRIFFEFADNGCGIPSEKLTKIFDTFFTTKEIGKGTGMGLSVLSSLVGEMEGDVSVESTLKEETKFRVAFPLCSSDFTEEEGKVETHEMDKLSGKVLVVDDEELLREIMVNVLEEFDLEVAVASDGLEALERLEEETFDLVVTDIKMPRLSGAELLKKMKSQKSSPPVVIITGGMETEYSQEKRDDDTRENADGYIKKPFEVQEIHETMKRLLAA